MSVDVSDTTDSGAADGLAIAADRVLALLDLGNRELSVVVVGDTYIRALNRQWRGKDRVTDVLSFPQLDADSPHHRPRGQPLHLGDVVISIETARRQADEGGWTLAEELNRLLVHAVLHLLGYDHELGAGEEARMKAEEARVAQALVEAGIPCAREDG